MFLLCNFLIKKRSKDDARDKKIYARINREK